LGLDDNRMFTYHRYYHLLWNAVHEVGTNHGDIEFVCYVWHMIVRPIGCFVGLLELDYWFPTDFYELANNFIWTHEPGIHMHHYNTLIPWVQSVVIKHYVLGREVFFRG
jgi:hypothetical protein